MRKTHAAVFAFSLALAVVSTRAAGTAAPQTPAPSASGIDVQAIDRTADACGDFYQFTCGGWLATHPLPGDQARYGRFEELQERNNDVLGQILDKAASGAASDADSKRIGDYYGSCVDEGAIDARGTAPLDADFARIDAVKSPADLAPVVAALHMKGVGIFFSFGAAPDFKDASAVIAAAGQGGMRLPDRDYYLKDDEASRKIREQYVAHVARMFGLAGAGPAAAQAQSRAVMRIETALAQAALDRVSRRVPANIYHKVSMADLAALAPAFDWAAYVRALGGPPLQTLNVTEPEFMNGFNRVITGTPLADLEAYMRWHLLNANADFLPKAFRDEGFALQQVFTGAKEQRPRSKRCVDYTNGDLGESTGKAYVEQTFGAEGKARTVAMVTAIEGAMARDIQGIGWMSEATKQQALAKLKAVTNKVGYPDHWRDYAALQIVRGDAIGNSQRANAFEFRRQLDKIGKPPDRTEWLMTPPTVNAYYSPFENNINFPAGILQPPFFIKSADDAVNFGAAGAVVGHELTHGFDDQGRQFDAQGNLRDWWTAADARAFEERVACVANQYSGYTAVGDLKLNGKLTLGENAADNGGLRLGWMALTESRQTRPLSDADGFTPAQRFFIGWGQMWCENRTDAFARLHATTNVHAPGRYRVNGVVSNFPEFAEAFHCAAGSPMVNAQACRVW
jgi:putative endopeptidase